MTKSLFESIFSRVFLGITLTATSALAITQLINHQQLQDTFRKYTTEQVVIFRHNGQQVLIRDNQIPAEYHEFVQDYQEEMNGNIMVAFAAGFFLSLIAGVAISNQITKPISKLKQTIQAVTKSGFTLKAPLIGSREMKELIHSFNGLVSRLEQQDELRQELLENVTHELKTPLTKLRGQVEGMIDGVYQPDANTLKRLKNNLSQLDYLINSLYEVNQLEPDKTTLNKIECNVKELVEEAIVGYDDESIDFNLDISKRLNIKADKPKLKQIVDNLVSNAYKFTQKGSITIQADKKKLSIKDTGVGINQKHLPHIFDRLYRVDKSRSRETGGLGLGLFIVKKLVDLHGWQITVDSKQNSGATFTIYWNS